MQRGCGLGRGCVAFDSFGGLDGFDGSGGFFPPTMTANNGPRRTGMAARPSRPLTVWTVLAVFDGFGLRSWPPFTGVLRGPGRKVLHGVLFEVTVAEEERFTNNGKTDVVNSKRGFTRDSLCLHTMKSVYFSVFMARLT